MNLDADQVAALAPDAASLKAGRALASERHWSGLGRSPRAVWGLCQGSGSKPYQAQVDLAGPAFRCSCPSRKFPCKHALGLLLLTAAAPALAPDAEPPGWVSEWLESRAQRVERAQERAGAPSAPDPEAQARRQARREERVEAGIEELERWLHDLARQGLAHARTRPYGYWDEVAARLVDAQAPALASRVRALGGLAAAGGDDWSDELLAEAGLLQLLLRGYRRAADLPVGLQADVRALIGWTTPQEDVLESPWVRDRWAVVARQVEDDDRLRVQRIWLQGLDSGRQALILSFAPSGQPLEGSFSAGIVIDASLAFYPSAWPLRAILAEQHAGPVPVTELRGSSIGATVAARADALALQPWLARMPVCLTGVVPVATSDGWLAAEPGGSALPLACDRRGGWRLVALAGGRPLTLCGEWLGERIRPLSVQAEDRFVLL